MCFEEWFTSATGLRWSKNLDALAFEMWLGGRDRAIRATWDRLLKAHRLSAGMEDCFAAAGVAQRFPQLVAEKGDEK